MSKAALKKTLATLTPEQKDELILDLYSARKEAKEYLDFYVDPDIERLIGKTLDNIRQELHRKGKSGYNKPRIMKIRALIKNVETLNPGHEYVLTLRTGVIRLIAETAGAGFYFTEAYANSFCRLLDEAVREADAAGQLDPVVTDLRQIIEAMPSSPFRRASRFMRKSLERGLADSIGALAKRHS